jgi:hypothetical protein
MSRLFTSRCRCAASTSSVILPGTNQSDGHAQTCKVWGWKGRRAQVVIGDLCINVMLCLAIAVAEVQLE